MRSVSRNHRLRLWLLVAGVCALPSTGIAETPAWVEDGLKLSREIEAQDRIITEATSRAFEGLAQQANGTEKLRMLHILARDAVIDASAETMARFLPLYRAEIERQGSDRYQNSAELLAAYAIDINRNDPNEAVRAIQSMLDSNRLDPAQQVEAYSYLAYINADNNHSGEALAAIRAGYEVISKASVDPDQQIQIAKAKAYTLMSVRDDPKLIATLRDVYDLHLASGLPCEGQTIVHNLAWLYQARGYLAAADETAGIFNRLAMRSGREHEQFYAKFLSGRIAMEREDFEDAETFLMDSQRLLAAVPERTVEVYLRTADTLLHLKRYDDAQRFLDKAKGHPRYAKDGEWHARAERMTLDILHARGRFTEAYERLGAHYRTLLAKRDDELGRVADELRKLTRAESAQLKERAELLKSRTVLQGVVIARQRQIVLLSAMVIVGGLVFIIWQLRTSRKLRQARNQALSASAAKSEFLANMSHEIRTPMHGVLGMAELLQQTALNDKQRSFVDTVYNSGSALLAIIDDILDFSKIEAGKMPLEAAPFRLRAAVEDVAALMACRAREKQVELITRLQPDLPQVVEGDVGRIRQVLTNLVGNAVKFTDTGYVLVDVSGEEEHGRLALSISVKDTGIGIPPHKQAVIFEQFTQAEGSTTRKYGGTGLGLSITKSLVQAMGGSIELETELGKGSTFCLGLSLPVGQPIDEIRVQLQALRVLVVDDLDVNRDILIEQLSTWGLEVTAVPSGAKALDVLIETVEAGSAIPLMVTDFQMPHMDGAELVRRVRADPRIASTKVIVLSSVECAGNEEIFGDVQALLTKPIRASSLRFELARVFADSGKSGGVERPAENSGAAVEVEDPMTGPFRLLVAEDNVVNRKILENMLDAKSYQTVFAEDGQQAYEAFQGGDYDVVLMDVSMPVMDGVESTKAIRAYEAGSGVTKTPIIALTAHAMEGDRERFLAAGMDDYLTKPVRREELSSAIAKWIPVDGSMSATQNVKVTEG